MANELIAKSPFGEVEMRDPAQMAKAMQAAAEDGALGMLPDGSNYLNFTGKRGVYEYGSDKEDISKDELWLVNIYAMEQGWICWKSSRPVATRLASIFGAPVMTPDSQELGPFNVGNGEGWHKGKSITIKSLDTPDRQGYFKINSKSGVAVFSALQDEIAENMAAGMPCWPIITLDKEKFQAQGQWNYKPKFTVYGWLSLDAVKELAADPSIDIDALLDKVEKGVLGETPAPKPAPKVEPTPEPEPEPEAEEVPAEQRMRPRRARPGL